MPFALWKQVVESSSHPLWLLNSDGGILYANAVALRIMGMPLSPDPMVSWSWLTPQTEARLHTAWQQSLAEGGEQSIELQSRSGLHASLTCTVRPLIDSTSNQTFVLIEGHLSGLPLDTTAHHTQNQDVLGKLQAKLAATQSTLEELQQIGKSGYWTWDGVRRRFNASRGLQYIFGREGLGAGVELTDYLAALHPADHTLFYQGVDTGADQDYYVRIYRPNGELRYIYGTWHLERDAQGKVVYAHGTCYDVTSQHDTTTLFAAQVHQIFTLNQMAQLITSSHDEAHIYTQVIAHLHTLVEAQSLLVCLDGRDYGIVCHQGHALPQHVEAGCHAVDFIVQQGRTAVKPMLLTGRIGEREARAALTDLLGYTPTDLIVVPLWWQQKLIGVLSVFYEGEHTIAEEFLPLVQTTAVWLTIALLNLQWGETERLARLYTEDQHQQMHRLARGIVEAQETERQRIARELHDEAGQALVAVKMQLAFASRQTEASELLSDAIQLVNETMENIRRLAYNLHPPSLEAFGLARALDGLCRDYQKRTGLQVTYAGIAVPELPREVTLALYRFAQEALTNTVKHAQAQHAHVQLQYDSPLLTLSVADDGCGFDPTLTSQGMGLQGMDDRISLIGGEYTVRSAVGIGTTVTVTLTLC